MLLVDCGGTSLQISVLETESDGIISVIAERNSVELAGQVFDRRLVQHCIEVFKESTGLDILNSDKDEMNKLLQACEDAKIKLNT